MLQHKNITEKEKRPKNLWVEIPVATDKNAVVGLYYHFEFCESGQ